MPNSYFVLSNELKSYEAASVHGQSHHSLIDKTEPGNILLNLEYSKISLFCLPPGKNPRAPMLSRRDVFDLADRASVGDGTQPSLEW